MYCATNVYKQIKRIRYFETLLLELFSEGRIKGTTHTCIGQESTAVAYGLCKKDQDFTFSNHRCHGHYIAATNDPTGLFLEIIGDDKGLCAGIGGSQHIFKDNFYSNGVQGNSASVAVGAALAQKKNSINEAITWIFIGDGTLGQGALYEALNLASLLNVPILFVLENNGIAQTTPIEKTVSGKIEDRFKAFDIKTLRTDSRYFQDLYTTLKKASNFCRKFQKPAAVIVKSYRLAAHSKGDDTREENVLAEVKSSDPLSQFEKEHELLNREEVEIELVKEINTLRQIVAD